MTLYSLFIPSREKIRQKYANWNEFVLPLGRLSEFSSLRKLQMEKYRMQEVLIDRKCAAPRFVIKPTSTFAVEGHSARFTCRIISLTATTISWYHNNVELRQSVKYMKRYIGDDYTFIINRVKVSDRGEFIIRAENHYGVTEEIVFLNVQVWQITRLFSDKRRGIGQYPIFSRTPNFSVKKHTTFVLKIEV